MEQSQISIRPNREYTPAPPLALFLARGGLVVVAVVVFVVDVSPPVLLRRRCRRCSRWSCRLSTSLSLVTVPKVLQNTPLRSVGPVFFSLLPFFPPIYSSSSYFSRDRYSSFLFYLGESSSTCSHFPPSFASSTRSFEILSISRLPRDHARQS